MKNDINPMCHDCAQYGKKCAGTTCHVWTTCLLKLSNGKHDKILDRYWASVDDLKAQTSSEMR